MSRNTLTDFRIDTRSGFTTPCHVFLGGLNGPGYGQLSRPVEGTRLVHLAAWRVTNGPVPTSFELDHACRVRVCRNVEHLSVVTSAENTRRRVIDHSRRRKPQFVHTGRLELGGTCQSGRHVIGPQDIARRRCLACYNEACAVSRVRFHQQSLAAQRGDWVTFRRLATNRRPVPAVEFAQPAV
ncbi:HNH endonuclease [Lentzea aerocolonigenes]|nr:HNH endonuclease [Lentzea aerocolonigenes]